MAFRYNCAIKFCFQRAGNINITPTCLLRATFSPTLHPCIADGPKPGCDWWTANGITVDAGGWNVTPHFITDPLDLNFGKIDFIDFTAITQGSCIGHCHTFCFRIPNCFDTVTTVVKIFDLEDDLTCASQTILLKQSPFVLLETKENLQKDRIPLQPLLLTESNAMRATIPFTMPVDGIARLMIYDQTLREVYRFEQEFAPEAIRHFTLRGASLPTGNYFYSIEAPIGSLQVFQRALIIK